jgi:hypothetical protein
MESAPVRDFGKRRPATPPLHAEPVKRSQHVALLLMGTVAIAGGAYAMMPRENCEPKGSGMTAAALPQAGTECQPRGGAGHGGSGGSSSHSYFFGGGPSSSRTSSGSSTESVSADTTRGGFGGFARAFAAHFSGGG